ncbi:4Fe-4S dicluster domain-containing protein [Sporomusa acidovorans]|uniref:4Fe-4S dicluster domain-containing protein n=1 Tax=Sporomusa acidovorans TaxID=112900 RepID=UPI003CCBD1EA
MSSQFVYYLNLTSNHGKAGDCIECRQCEKACPQHLKIVEHLKDVSELFDNGRAYRQNNQLLPYVGYPRTLNAIRCLNEIIPE